jgi:spermidine synthase
VLRELDFRQTPLGELVLRSRSSPSLGGKTVFEVLLDGEFLMSSEVTASETALAQLALQQLHSSELQVLVGGLGLGHTAATVLDDPRVRKLAVLEYLPPVIEWHQKGLVPLGGRLVADPRCRLELGDFFAAMRTPPAGAADRYDAIVVDIDHSPESLLQAGHAEFYSPGGLAALRQHLHPAGIFALWSADPPPETFLRQLEAAFERVSVHPIEFFNPFVHEVDENSVILAQRR